MRTQFGRRARRRQRSRKTVSIPLEVGAWRLVVGRAVIPRARPSDRYARRRAGTAHAIPATTPSTRPPRPGRPAPLRSPRTTAIPSRAGSRRAHQNRHTRPITQSPCLLEAKRENATGFAAERHCGSQSLCDAARPCSQHTVRPVAARKSARVAKQHRNQHRSPAIQQRLADTISIVFDAVERSSGSIDASVCVAQQ